MEQDFLDSNSSFSISTRKLPEARYLDISKRYMSIAKGIKLLTPQEMSVQLTTLINKSKSRKTKSWQPHKLINKILIFRMKDIWFTNSLTQQLPSINRDNYLRWTSDLISISNNSTQLGALTNRCFPWKEGLRQQHTSSSRRMQAISVSDQVR